jgi:hypothetical protein
MHCRHAVYYIYVPYEFKRLGSGFESNLISGKLPNMQSPTSHLTSFTMRIGNMMPYTCTRDCVPLMIMRSELPLEPAVGLSGEECTWIDYIMLEVSIQITRGLW